MRSTPAGCSGGLQKSLIIKCGCRWRPLSDVAAAASAELEDDDSSTVVGEQPSEDESAKKKQASKVKIGYAEALNIAEAKVAGASKL